MVQKWQNTEQKTLKTKRHSLPNFSSSPHEEKKYTACIYLGVWEPISNLYYHGIILCLLDP